MKILLIVLAALAGFIICTFAILAFALTAIHHMNKYMKEEDKHGRR